MGGIKRLLEASEMEGWNAPDKNVCVDCVHEPYLKSVIEMHAASNSCDYCGNKALGMLAAPLEELFPFIASAVYQYFNDPSPAGVPYDGGFLIDGIGSEEMLRELSDAFDGLLLEDIAAGFYTDTWVPSSQGYYASEHMGARWISAWKVFQDAVKHKSRYFFFSNRELNGHFLEYGPADTLEAIAKQANQLKLIHVMAKGTALYRVRTKSSAANWEISESELSAPPNHLAASGRMNPAGISYLYLATAPNVAFGEVLSSPPCIAALATFETQKELKLLNLSSLPNLPSVFDSDSYALRQSLQFLMGFVRDITVPVQKDGREHVSYVPSQVVSEYFSQVFLTEDNKPLDGILYPSAVQPDGKNVVIFPPNDETEFKDVAQFISGKWHKLLSWSDISHVITASALR